MTLQLAAAATSRDTAASVISVAVALVTLALVVMLLVTCVRGRRLQPPRTAVGVPLILTAVGAAFAFAIAVGSSAAGLQDTTLHGIDYLIGGIDIADSLLLGTMRGVTIRLYQRDGESWSRYGRPTVALWIVSILIRVGLAIVGSAHHASPLVEADDLLFMLGLTLLCQNVVVAWRHAQSQTQPGQAAR